MIYVAGIDNNVDNVFGTISLQTRVYSQIANTTQMLSALATNNGQLYATSFSSTSTLYTLSDTGTLAPVGGTGTQISGLAFNASGTLYASDYTNDALGTLNLSTGVYADIGGTGYILGNTHGQLAFSSGVLYAAISDSSELLASLDLTNGAASQIGSSNSLYGNMNLFAAQNALYGIATDNHLYSINTSSAELFDLGAITGSDLPIAFSAAVAGPTDVPEPATLGLFAIGGLALRWRGKRSR